MMTERIRLTGASTAELNADAVMRSAIEAALTGITKGQSPFGAAVAKKDGTLIHAAHNTVRLDNDPTAHAEVNAIRGAARALGTIDLSGHVMITTCEPCPMCAAAIHWARFDAVYYGATIADAEAAGFHELALSCERLYRDGRSEVVVRSGVLAEECRKLFGAWRSGPNPSPY